MRTVTRKGGLTPRRGGYPSSVTCAPGWFGGPRREWFTLPRGTHRPRLWSPRWLLSHRSPGPRRRVASRMASPSASPTVGATAHQRFRTRDRVGSSPGSRTARRARRPPWTPPPACAVATPDPRSGVRHPEQDLAGTGLDGDGDLSPGRGVTHGVVGQVAEQDTQTLRVAAHVAAGRRPSAPSRRPPSSRRLISVGRKWRTSAPQARANRPRM